MSFLKDLQSFQKKTLHKTDTVLETKDGRRIQESRDEQGQVTTTVLSDYSEDFVQKFQPNLKMEYAGRLLEKMSFVFKPSVPTNVGEIKVYKDTCNPTLAWQKLAVKQTVDRLEPVPYSTPIQEDHLRFVCVSDTHSRTAHAPNLSQTEMPSGDVLLHAGDFTNIGQPSEIKAFNDWLGTMPHTHKVVIAGNHDLMFEPDNLEKGWTRFGLIPAKVKSDLKSLGVSHVKELLTNCTFLEDSETTVCGIQIHGSPWQPEFCDWAFNLPRGQACLDKWNLIPDGVDILMTHGPPIGHGDLCSDNQRAGCVELLHTIQQRVKPRYHIFGHIHEDYGVTTDGNTIFINASTCNLRYKPVQPPIIFDFPIPAGHSKTELLDSLVVTSHVRLSDDKQSLREDADSDDSVTFKDEETD